MRRFATAWDWLERLRLLPRWIVKTLLLSGIVLFVLYPNPVRLVQQIQHLSNVESLIQPDLPELVAINAEITSNLKTNATRKEEFRAVEAYVYSHIRYEYDWFNWGNLDYWPTAREVLERKREDCDGRAVLAASILRARGFHTANVVGNLQHVWVTVDHAELMGPQPDRNFQRVDGKVVVTLPQWQTILASTAMINKFPALRCVVILLTVLVLAYHPCRSLTGFLGLSVAGLLGFVVFLDWSNRYEPRLGGSEIGLLATALGLLGFTWIAALLAHRWLRSRALKP